MTIPTPETIAEVERLLPRWIDNAHCPVDQPHSRRLASVEECRPAVSQALQSLKDRNAELEAAISWALGEGDSDFGNNEPSRVDGAKRAPYWWRAELRRRANPAQQETEKS